MANETAQKVSVSDLKPGMYISSLDRPWLDTPFLMQGFVVDSESDINDLAKYCAYVYVDTARTRQHADDQHSLKDMLAPDQQDLQRIFPHRKLRRHDDQTTINNELPTARKVMGSFNATVKQVFDDLSSGAPIKVNDVRTAVEPVVDSIIRNPDACIWLTRLKRTDDYTYHHSVSSSIWAVALGRHIGLPKKDLQTLAIGVTLFDIGKMQLPKELLTRQGKLTEQEFELVKSHVYLGVNCLKASGGVNNSIIDIVLYHHERHDGSGYPKGLRGDEIPVFARIAAIADCYDAITTKRPYARPISPGRAVKMLYSWRNEGFQAELVEEFIQAIGIYPAGTIVELSNGDVGVVLAEYRTRRLRPKIIQLLDSAKNPLPTVKVIDLLTTTHDESGKPLEIIDSLEPDAYGLTLESLAL